MTVVCKNLLQRWVPLVGLACAVLLGSCDQGTVASSTPDCQVIVLELSESQGTLAAQVASEEYDTDGLLAQINRWLITRDNAFQQLRLAAVIGNKSEGELQACYSSLNQLEHYFFSDPQLWQALNSLDVTELAVATQHFINKLRFQFTLNGAFLDAGDREKLQGLATESDAAVSLLSAEKHRAWLENQRALSQLLGFPDALSAHRAQQMLPLNTMVNSFLTSQQLVLADTELEQQNSSQQQRRAQVAGLNDLVFEWSRVKTGLIQLATLFNLELAPSELHLPVALASGWQVESWQLFANGQAVGELFLVMRTTSANLADGFDYLPLRPGITPGQTSSFVIVGEVKETEQTLLLDQQQLVSLLHQFGHFLHHHFAGQQQWTLNAGLSTEAEFLEAPALLLEYWGWTAEGLAFFTGKQLDAQMLRSEQVYQQHRNNKRLLDQAIATEKWLAEASTGSAQSKISVIDGIEYNNPHCLQDIAVIYRCLVASQVAEDLAGDFFRFGFNDKQSAQKLVENILRVGSARSAMDMLATHFDESYTLY